MNKRCYSQEFRIKDCHLFEITFFMDILMNANSYDPPKDDDSKLTILCIEFMYIQIILPRKIN